jgi:hypothetical protein
MNDIIQRLSSPDSPLLSAGLSSSQIHSVLQDASPSDVVQLSNQALQLQEVDNLFGASDTSQTAGLFSASSTSSPSATLDSILASLPAGSDSTTSNTSEGSTSSLASQVASYQSELQAEETQALFGTVSTGVSGASLNVLA